LEVQSIGQTQLGQQVYDRIAKALLTGQIRPNDKLTIRGLAEKLNVSTTPVRDAIKQLTYDQVLEMRSTKDVRVPVLSERDYLEILDIRLSLEGLAAERAAQHAKASQIKALQRLLDRNERAVARRNWGIATEGNQEFHLALSDIAGMPNLQKILRGLWLRMGPLIACYYDTEPEGLNTHHLRLVAALEARDPMAARQAMQDDLSSAREAMLERIGSLRAQHFAGAAA
jgi:DNA-binding GntR family transcriptional regulator